MNNSPESDQLQTAFDTFQSCLGNQQFPLAEEWLNYLEQLLGQPTSAQPGEFGEQVNRPTDDIHFEIPAGEGPGSAPELGWVPDEPETSNDEQPEVREEAPAQAVNANCMITVTNNTQAVLSLMDQFNTIGDFMTNPASSIQPGGSTSFVFVHTPNDNNPANAGCAGGLTWQVGTTVAATWRVTWNNFVGQKNTADGTAEPATAGFQSLEQIGQGDENVPVTFTLSGGSAVPVCPPPVQPPVGPVPPPACPSLSNKAEIMAFQKEHGLVADGIIGPKTRAALVKAGCEPPPAVKPPVQPYPSQQTQGQTANQTTTAGGGSATGGPGGASSSDSSGNTQIFNSTIIIHTGGATATGGEATSGGTSQGGGTNEEGPDAIHGVAQVVDGVLQRDVTDVYDGLKEIYKDVTD